MDSEAFPIIDITGDLFKGEAVARVYDSCCRQAYGDNFGTYAADIDYLLDLTSYTPSNVIVDLCCGTGISTARIVERNPRKVIGVDFSDAMISIARDKFQGQHNIEFIVAPAEQLSDIVAYADKVVTANGFGYFTDSKKVLREIWSIVPVLGEYLFNVGIRCEGESVYQQLFRVLSEVFSAERRERIEIPIPNGLEPVYDKTALEALVTRNEFVVMRYEERIRTITKREMTALYDQVLTHLSQALEPLGTTKAARVCVVLKDQLVAAYKEQPPTRKEAYLCLRKE